MITKPLRGARKFECMKKHHAWLFSQLQCSGQAGSRSVSFITALQVAAQSNYFVMNDD